VWKVACFRTRLDNLFVAEWLFTRVAADKISAPEFLTTEAKKGEFSSD